MHELFSEVHELGGDVVVLVAKDLALGVAKGQADVQNGVVEIGEARFVVTEVGTHA